MELVHGLFCGKTHPMPRERSGRESGTDYSFYRDFIAGSIKINFLSTYFLHALNFSTNSGSHTGTYKASSQKRKGQVTLKGVLNLSS